MLLTNTDKDGAERYIEKLNRGIFNDLYIDFSDNQRIQVSVSAGIAASDIWSPDELIKQADKLMYDNKRKFYKNKRMMQGQGEITTLEEVKYNIRKTMLEQK